MTDRLHDLLTAEADGLDVPSPPTAAILTRGRGVRRRRAALTVVSGVAAVAAIAVVAGGIVALAGGDGSNTAPDVAAGRGGAVYAAGNEVFVDGGTRSVTIQDKAVKSLYYTSAGVLVRQGNNANSDGGGPQRFSLIAQDGSLHPVSVETEETVHATDPDQPDLAYAQDVDGTLTVYVHDVATDEQVAAVEVGATKEGWFPVAIDGDHVYVQDGYGGASYDVDWRTGAVTALPAGLTIIGSEQGYAFDRAGDLVSLPSGDRVLDLPKGSYGSVSPDGTHVKVSSEAMADRTGDGGTAVYDIRSGTSTPLDGDAWSWAFTPDGSLFRLTDDGTLTSCAADGTDCGTSKAALPHTPPEVCTTSTRKAHGGILTEESCEGGTLDLILGNTVRES